MSNRKHVLSHSDLLKLKRWNTPTIYNGWEQITQHDVAADSFNIDETHDFMPQMRPMVGYAVTVVLEPSNAEQPKNNPDAASQYRETSSRPAAPPSPQGIAALPRTPVQTRHW